MAHLGTQARSRDLLGHYDHDAGRAGDDVAHGARGTGDQVPAFDLRRELGRQPGEGVWLRQRDQHRRVRRTSARQARARRQAGPDHLRQGAGTAERDRPEPRSRGDLPEGPYPDDALPQRAGRSDQRFRAVHAGAELATARQALTRSGRQQPKGPASNCGALFDLVLMQKI